VSLGVTHATPGAPTVACVSVRRKLFQRLGLVTAGTPLEPVRDAVAPSGPRFRLAVRFRVQPLPLFRGNPLLRPPRFPGTFGATRVAPRVSTIPCVLARGILFQRLDFATLRAALDFAHATTAFHYSPRTSASTAS